jgi:hypothetical protein
MKVHLRQIRILSFWHAFQYFSGVNCRKLLAGAGNTAVLLVCRLCVVREFFPCLQRDTDVKYTYEVWELQHLKADQAQKSSSELQGGGRGGGEAEVVKNVQFLMSTTQLAGSLKVF